MSLPKRVSDVVLRAYKRKKQASANLSLAHCLRVARITATRTKYCHLVTTAPDGPPRARLVQPIVEEDDFRFFIGTHPQSRKVAEIGANSAVTLAFNQSGEDASLVVYGTATVHRTPAVTERYWKSAWRLFFPDGPQGDDYAVVEVRADKLELISFQRNVIPEPFGLRPVVLVRNEAGWRVKE
ncbi:MAG: pyridoxamine 5'-phosphate oxidase family protein [Tunicatimonas sp.]